LSPALQTALFSSATLAEFYRFAVLLTGDHQLGQQIVAETLAEVEGQLGQFRHETSRQAWLATRIRERCLRAGASLIQPAPRLLRDEADTGCKLEVLQIEAYLVAQRFHFLPEPERSALALFYLDFFTVDEIAKLLKIPEHDLPDTLARARALLQDQLRAMRATAS
jgi:DNA-directed RNA polymerase specialized sigma24 family protein